MSKNSALEKFEELPPEAQKLANDFVEYLYDCYVSSDSAPSSDRPISESPFVGMWKDRRDLAGSTAWVRKQRKEFENRFEIFDR